MRFDAVLQLCDVEINKQTRRYLGESNVRKNLCLMDWKNRFDAFDFDDEIAAYEQIDPIAAIEQEIFVTNGQWQLHLKRNARVRELTSEALPIVDLVRGYGELRLRIRSRFATTHQIPSSCPS